MRQKLLIGSWFGQVNNQKGSSKELPFFVCKKTGINLKKEHYNKNEVIRKEVDKGKKTKR